jgi:hypothetical integral membrane protein (TIGR02206 family)
MLFTAEECRDPPQRYYPKNAIPNSDLATMNQFEPYTLQHALPIVLSVLFGIIVIYKGRKLSERNQRLLGTSLSLVVLGSMVIGNLILLARDEYTVTEDLPLYLCRVVAWILPLAIWNKWRNVLGVIYFWIMAGTLQGIITPDLAEGFPDYFFFRYWSLHAGLVVTTLYAVLVFRLCIGWKDFWRAIIVTQFYLGFVHLANVMLESNYSYTMRKPPGTSILDFMGEWPWYILAGEGMMVVLFLLFLLPYLVKGSDIFKIITNRKMPACHRHGKND